LGGDVGKGVITGNPGNGVSAGGSAAFTGSTGRGITVGAAGGGKTGTSCGIIIGCGGRIKLSETAEAATIAAIAPSITDRLLLAIVSSSLILL
jgi:hypothetical protein